MNKNLDEIEWTIFDTETTGLEPQSGDRIVEIAAIRFKGRDQLAVFETLVNPQRPISPGAFQVNRISAEMLKSAPCFENIASEFLKFIQGSCLCSYNAGFDMEFLRNELKLAGREFPDSITVLDVLKMARRLIPGLERYALWFVAEKLEIKVGETHRALCDVKLTLGVFNKLKEVLKTKNLFEFKNFSELFSIDAAFLNNLNNHKIARIEEAIVLGVRLKIKYLSVSRAQVTERQVIPKEIRRERNSLYLVGHCCLRNEERSFRIDGILHLEII
ncbi:MAG: exonuclease domain-containing protein [Candidatus Omnitrophota bacterium]